MYYYYCILIESDVGEIPEPDKPLHNFGTSKKTFEDHD